jgi:hypothetical protein
MTISRCHRNPVIEGFVPQANGSLEQDGLEC